MARCLAGRVLRQFVRGVLRLGESAGNEPTLPVGTANLGTLLRGAGYTVAYKGKWHLTHPSAPGRPGSLLGGWTARDATTLSELGFGDWEPPDAGENAKAEHFGGGNAGDGDGWDEVYTRQAETWLGRADLPEPFCLVVSLVNPHDVLGYPASYVARRLRSGRASGSRRRPPADGRRGPPQQAGRPHADADRNGRLSRRSRVPAGRSVTTSTSTRTCTVSSTPRSDGCSARSARPTIQSRCGHGRSSSAAPTTARWDSLTAACARRCSMPTRRRSTSRSSSPTRCCSRTASRPMRSPRSSTSSPLCSRSPGARLPDDLRGRDLTPILAHASPAMERPASASVQDAVHFTYDDHQAGTATQDAPGQPNRVRAIRTARRQVRGLLRSSGTRRQRVRAVRPGRRSARGPKSARRAIRPATLASRWGAAA